MMYFSRIALDPELADARRLARLALSERYREHQVLWHMFDDDPDAKRDFLFRREIMEGWPRYHVVSVRPPSDKHRMWKIESKEYNPRIRKGQRLSFKLRVNPVVNRKNEHGKGKRHDIVMDAKKRSGYQASNPSERTRLATLIHEAGCAWLHARAAGHGFDVSPQEVIADGYRQHRTHKKAMGSAIRYSTLDFDGRLTATDPDKLVHALFHGIGPAKAFGCGLLMVRFS